MTAHSGATNEHRGEMEREIVTCPVNPPRPCNIEQFDRSIMPYAFIIYPKQWKSQKKLFQDIIENNVKVKIDDNWVPLKVKGFDDFYPVAGNNFCHRVCKPIQMSEFCIANCRHNERKIIAKKLGYGCGTIKFPNENVWWEAGIAMGFGQKVIVFIDKGQRIPSDFANNILVQNLGKKSDIENNLRDIFLNPINFGERIQWSESGD